MSVVRGRPPGLAGGIIGASRAYCSSLRACPAPKSPTSARLSAVHLACLREGLLPSRTADATAPPHARLDGASFSNGLLALGAATTAPIFVRISIVCARRFASLLVLAEREKPVRRHRQSGELPEEPVGQQSNFDPQRERQRDHDHRGLVDVEPFLLVW